MSRHYDTLDNLIHKIFKFLSHHDKSSIKQHIIRSAPINESLSAISNIVFRHTKRHPIFRNESRQDFIAEKMLAYMRRMQIKVETMQMADIGGGNGDVMSYMQTQLKNSVPEQFVCVETANDWVETYPYNNTNIRYLFWNNDTIDIADNTCDIVVCMVSLHHMNAETLQRATAEICRMLKPGGKLLIKEHNVFNDSVLNLVEWEHHLYHILDCAYSNVDIDVDEYLKQTIHSFHSQTFWKQHFTTGAMFQHVETSNRFLDGIYEPRDNKNPTQLYWDLFVKL